LPGLRVARGLYAVPDAEISTHRSLVEVARAVPAATVCLLSALRFPELTTQAPPEIWIALDVHAWRPRRTSTGEESMRCGALRRSAAWRM
jgi:predicted transcriptional regulator of viral defense system